MLIEFSVSNFRSFKEKATFSMVAADVHSSNNQIDDNNIFEVKDGLKLLKSSAIYGANASGKSNLFRALSFMRFFVLNSSKETQIAEAISVESFRLSLDSIGKPSVFEIAFIMEGDQYQYSFSVDTKIVVTESLYKLYAGKRVKLFDRTTTNIRVTKSFQEGKELISKTRNNALFLSVVAQFNGALSEKILVWFKNLSLASALHDLILRRQTTDMLRDNNLKEDLLGLIRKLDIDISDIRIEKGELPSFEGAPEEIRGLIEELKKVWKSVGGEPTELQTSHKQYDSDGKPVSYEIFKLDTHESEGTRKLIALSGVFIDTLKNARTLFIDDIDACLHPLITQAFVGLFNSNKLNSKNAQLIFITHDTNLLNKERFRLDQIWFVEKDRLGASHLYSLVEFKVNDDASIGADYIKGKYGAIPFLSDLKNLFDISDG